MSKAICLAPCGWEGFVKETTPFCPNCSSSVHHECVTYWVSADVRAPAPYTHVIVVTERRVFKPYTQRLTTGYIDDNGTWRDMAVGRAFSDQETVTHWMLPDMPN